ncbi:MAG TPA: porphobilinogen synthase [Sedimentisphaerales bacterium]|nr:porphobilinogen synthase [Sedimentisphaerales bacterium]
MAFPQIRMRRLRAGESMRRLVRETVLTVDDLVHPLFVKSGTGLKQPISSMQGCYHFSPDLAAQEAAGVAQSGIPAVLLFGLPEKKDKTGSRAWAENGPVQQAVREIKNSTPNLLVITDVCLCAYTESSHCGLTKDGTIDNDATCELLAKVALSHAQAGADIVAPSDMMDGRVGYIRQTLEKNGFHQTGIMSYSAKYASAFYGPFRDAADSAPAPVFAGTVLGDRKSYQMDPACCRQAMREIELDIAEGADIVMVKPALCFLDIIAHARQRFDVPIAAYNVSGEYMMLNAAAKAGYLDRNAAMMEMLYSIKRAGADIIITYFAKEAAALLK